MQKYKEFMEEEETGNCENIASIGDNTEKREESKDKKTAVKNLDEILLAAGVSEEEFKLIKSGSRRRSLTGLKVRYAREALELNYTLKAIGENIKVSEVAIFDLLERNNLIS